MGKEFRFIHCADLHLGSRFKGLGQENSQLAERMRRSIMDSFSRIVDCALENSADAMVISGDLYDDSNELPSTRMWFSDQLRRLEIPVYICRGNHDSETRWDETIPYPPNVHEFGKEPERIAIGEDVEIVGISYSEPHETRNLAAMLKGSPDRFTIACVHCDLDSYSEGYPYAPCSMNDLISGNIDYWALGHIHKREIVSTSPYVVYPGNIQGRSFKETGPKGAYLVTVDSGRVEKMDFIPTCGYVWEDLTVDITGRNWNDIMLSMSDKVGRNTVCRFTFVGSGSADTMLRTSTDDIAGSLSQSTGCIVSSISVKTSPEVDLETRSHEKDMGAAVIRAGGRIAELSKDQIVDIICQNKVASRYRDYYMSLSEEEIEGLVTDSMKSIIARMEVAR